MAAPLPGFQSSTRFSKAQCERFSLALLMINDLLTIPLKLSIKTNTISNIFP
jgi:hypothetical protein